jgi:hypothetical protein
MYQVDDQVRILSTVPDHLRRYVGKVGTVIELAFDLFVVDFDDDRAAGFGESEIELVTRPEDQRLRAIGAPELPGLE